MPTRALLNAVSTSGILERVLPLLPGRTYLVGGCIRDLLLGIEPADFDIVTFGPAMELARRMGTALGGTVFAVDRERGVARIALNRGEHTLDISPARGADIEGDLRERDITINAMACLPGDGVLIDPLQGLADLRAGCIRLIGEKNLRDDPLRGLRCLRFAVQLGYSIEAQSMGLIIRHAHAIERVASERIKHEFLRALDGPRGTTIFGLLDKAGYVGVLMGDTAPKPTAVFMEGPVRYADVLLDDASRVLPGVGTYFTAELEHGMTRAAAFRIAAFLFPGTGEHDRTHELMSRLALSVRARRTIGRAMAGARRAISLAGGPRPGGGAMYRVLSDHDGSIPEMLLLVLASSMGAHDGRPDQAGAVCRLLWEFYTGPYRTHRDEPLLSGHDIIRELDIRPGADVGKLLRRVEEARADGLISSRREALALVRTSATA